MGQLDDDRSNLELLLRFAEFGALISDALKRTSGGAKVTDNISITVLCHLELSGPLRPNDLVERTGMTSGGVTKVITRLENAGLASRSAWASGEDRRAVGVVLTEEGHELMEAFARELGIRISESAVFIKDLNRFVD